MANMNLIKKIKAKIDKLNKKINMLTKNNKLLRKNMKEDNFPKGQHIYVLEDDGKYKIGFTINLKKRLSAHNTSSADKINYVYYKKTQCGAEIEKCLKAMLNKYIYRKNKEFYNCDLDVIIDKISKCLKIEKNCFNCKDIKKYNMKGGGKIISEILKFYTDKKNYYSDIYPIK
jgi:predicted GIY-YIG superfamily endonuclease